MTDPEWSPQYREMLGRTGLPVAGDKLVCLKNNHGRWLYTAITRAQEAVTVVRPGWC